LTLRLIQYLVFDPQRVGVRLERLLVFVMPFALASLLVSAAGGAGGGQFDPSFGSGGKKVVDLGHTEEAFDLAVQPDGKLVLAGTRDHSQALVVRLNPDGSPDSSFGNGGVVVVPVALGFAVALQADGKILVGAGSFGDLAVLRLLPDGRVDTAFGSEGRAFANFGGADVAFALTIQPDGKIVAVGRTNLPPSTEAGDFAVARFNPDGGLDASFDGDGRVRTDFGVAEDALDVVLQSDGKIVVVGAPGIYGSPWAVARYNVDGSLDSSFDGDGKVTTDFGGGAQGAWGVAMQPDGKIVVAGWKGEQGGPVRRGIALARYLPDGSMDRTFSGDGRAVASLANSDTGRDVVLQANGKIVVAGQTGGDPDFMLMRFLPDGRLDPSFADVGYLQTDFGGHDAAWAVALDRQAHIIGAGESRAETTGGDITVASVPVGTCVVPRLSRATLAEATGMLERAGCRLGDAHRIKSRTVKRGRIVAQSPRPTTRLDDFAPVNVTLSRGKR
jgi:uncharacterized delta-60 repeat protein